MIITAKELRRNIGKYLSLASYEDVYITKSGKVIAVLTAPYESKANETNSNHIQPIKADKIKRNDKHDYTR